MSNTTNKLINNENSKKYDIHKRIYDFIIRVIKLVNSLPKTQSNLIIIGQILRSVTSVGANDQEADGTLTKRDFLHCYTIVRKEAKETYFWLSLIADTNPTFESRMQQILQESQELVALTLPHFVFMSRHSGKRIEFARPESEKILESSSTLRSESSPE